MRNTILLLKTTLLIAGASLLHMAPAQSITQRIDRSSADGAFTSRNYKVALREYQKLIADFPDDAYSWHRAGFCQLAQRKIEEAIISYQKCLDLKYQPELTNYNLACAYAIKGERDLSLDHLEKSVRAGFPRPALLTSDPDLASLRSTARYKTILEFAKNPFLAAAKGTTIEGAIGTWLDSEGGAFVFSQVSTKVAASIDFVVGGKRLAYLLVTFDGGTNKWFANGYDNFGNRYFEYIEMGSELLTISGGRTKTRARLQVRIDGANILTVTILEETAGSWRVRHEHRMTRQAVTGGR